MSLAHRLNDLAVAHAQHLISDDDYRLLRQNLFEKHSAEPAPSPTHVQRPQPQPPPAPPLRRKQSVVSGVANLFRRATGRSSKKQPRSATPPPELPSHDPDDPAALRILIASAEADHARLLDAFASLETSTLKRIQYKTARRLYTPTPTNVSVLIEGREWRKHTKPLPSIVLPPPSSSHRQPLPLSTSSSRTSDQLSIHSAASSSSKVSLSRSFSSLPRHSQQPLSPLSRSHTHALQRHDSISSASTQSTRASSRLAPTPRSVGNLYLTSLAETTTSSSADTVADDSRITDDDPEAADYDSALRELNGIRRRREDLNTRYASRLEYLKAKLRAAELHERVMRR